MGPLQTVVASIAETGKKLTEKAGEIMSGSNEKVAETVGSVTESVTGMGAEVTADIVTVASEVATAVKETVEDTIHIAKDAIDAGKATTLFVLITDLVQDKTLEGAVSQMVKVLKISVYQLVDEGFTKATVSSGVNVMGVVNLNVSVHLEEQMAVHFKRLEEKEKRRHKREKAAKAAARNGSSTPSAATPTSPPTPTPPLPTANALPTVTPDHKEMSVETKELREKKEKRPTEATELIQRIIEGDEAALKENAETHRHDVHEHRDCAPTPPAGKASRAVAQKKEARVGPAAQPSAGRARGKRAVAPKVVDDTPGSLTS